MNAIMFDTHRMVKQLIAAGFTDQQAESVTEVVSAARGFDVENLATKAELKQEIGLLRSELKQEVASLRVEIAGVRASIAEVKSDILRWVIGLAIAQGGLTVALIKLLP